MSSDLEHIGNTQDSLLQLIPAYLPQGVIVYDQDGLLKYANPTALEMFGAEMKDVLDLNIFNDPNVTDSDKVLLKKGMNVSFETDYDFDLCGDIFFDTKIRGRRKYFVTKVSIMRNENQHIEGYLLTCEDVSEKKYQEIELIKSHKKIKTIHENLSLALEAGKLSAWNYNIKEQVFYLINNDMRSEKKVTIEEVTNRLHPDEKEKYITFISSIINKEQTAGNIIIRLFSDSQNRYLYYDCRYLSVTDETGNTTNITFIHRDITHEREYHQELLRAKQRAEESDKLKSAFLANMSHEIRTPLNAILGFSDLLATSNTLQDKQQYVNIISANNDLLLHLINDILDLSKIEADTIEFQPECFDIAELFDYLYCTMKLKVNHLDIEFKVDNPYSSCWITTDKNRLQQIAINFITNAIKCTWSGYIQLGYQAVDNGIKIYVKDTGMGISKEDHPKVFKRFQKLNNFTQGTGLGLAICQAIIERCEGTIGFESELGVGSTFWAWIPTEVRIEEGERTEQTTQDHPNTSNREIAINLPPLHILIAEDNDSNYLLMEHILQGHHLTRAYNGKEVVEKAAEKPVELILMDIGMPIMSGLEATKTIRETNKEIIIIAVSANAFDTDRNNALKAGCNAFLAKPLKRKDLLATIEKLLKSSR